MLLLIISLLLNYDLFSCVAYERAKFDEALLMKNHHRNYLEVKTFIKEAQKKFLEDAPPPRVQSRGNTSTGDLDGHVGRARATFPALMTPYTTELNAHHLKWDEIFPIETTRRYRPKLRIGPKVSYTRGIPSHPPLELTLPTREIPSHPPLELTLPTRGIPSHPPLELTLPTREIPPHPPLELTLPTRRISSHPPLEITLPTRGIPSNPPLENTMPSPKYQKRFGPTYQPILTRLRINPAASSTVKSRPNPKLSSKTFSPRLQGQMSVHSTPQTANPFHPNSTFPTSLRGHSGKGLRSNLSFMTPNEEYKKKWLREITTYTPVESWFLALANKIGITPRFGLTTKHAPKLERTVSKTQASAPSKQLKTDFKHQAQLQLRNGLLTPQTTTKVDDHRISSPTIKKPKYIVENKDGILHLRFIPETHEGQTTTVGKRLAPASVKNVMMSLTTGYMLRRDQEPAAFKGPSNKKSRRHHLKPRKKHHHHHHKKVARQRYQSRYRHPAYRYQDVDYRRQQEELEYPMLRSSIHTPNKKHGEPSHPNARSQFPEYINTKDENLSKPIATQIVSRRKAKAQKDKISFFNQIKETLKQAESKTKAKRLKIKAELLRKIVEGSSYSDEEESLRKNLGQALQNGNRT